MAYEFFYPGTPYSLDPGYGEMFIGYRIPASEIGAPTSIQTANQIQEVSNLLNQGIKVIELQPLSAEVFDQIPKQHFKEINRLQKLAGAETSIHAPVLEPSGIGKEGWSETDRESAERQLKMVIDKSHNLDPKGNIIVNTHASAIQGAEFSPPPREMVDKYKEQIRQYEHREPTNDEIRELNEEQLVTINQETGQMTMVKREMKYYPEVGEKVVTPRDEVMTHNNTEWVNSITNLAFYKKEADETLKRAHAILSPLIVMKEKGEKIKREDLNSQQEDAFHQLGRSELFLENVESAFRTLYNKAYKYSEDENVKKFLSNEIAKPWQEERKRILEEKEKIIKGKERDFLDEVDMVIKKSNVIDETLNKLRVLENKPPEIYKPIEDFAIDKSARTFADAALYSYEKYKDKAPILSIENLPHGMAFSRSEELTKLIDETRKKFVDEAVKKGHGRGEAENASKKLIGATWDVGHINMLRKGGFKEEDIIKETEKIAKYVKHIHLTDNFGYSDSHLPPGMGNVPIKQILEELEKKGVSGKKIIEAGAFVQHFKIPPTQAVLEAFGSPLYPVMAAPYWNQAAYTFGGYFAGYGPFPEQHFSMYGTGFSGMPLELGGQIPGRQSRFAGTPAD